MSDEATVKAVAIAASVVLVGLIVRLIRLAVCFHKFETDRIIGYFDTEESKMPTFRTYILRCKNCGKIKTVEI